MKVRLENLFTFREQNSQHLIFPLQVFFFLSFCLVFCNAVLCLCTRKREGRMHIAIYQHSPFFEHFCNESFFCEYLCVLLRTVVNICEPSIGEE